MRAAEAGEMSVRKGPRLPLAAMRVLRIVVDALLSSLSQTKEIGRAKTRQAEEKRGRRRLEMPRPIDANLEKLAAEGSAKRATEGTINRRLNDICPLLGAVTKSSSYVSLRTFSTAVPSASAMSLSAAQGRTSTHARPM